ncbi:MMS19 nucleotide excision repair protein-like protein [Macrophomina phaseolina]|uniref:MMS19 nucleotide excision repair protein n=1 Tax=Macrophomina phaseolina TaxID=35725 RepID=A0ABQ8GLK5_9PEZI|nr:MMS19 nucleotide excision repair protein-like protein [Macrophomina phaseolina]
MSDVQLYLFEFSRNKDEAARIAAQTAERLESRKLKLLELIESLGEFLNSDDGPTRSKAMAYLADVLSATPPKVFTRQHRNLLCDFILSRIADDNEGIGSSAKALMALEERGAWEKERAATILSSLVDNTHPLRQFKLQSERYSVLRLIDMLMAKYREAVQSVHEAQPDFLSRFISYFDGEKDPRNLMVVFSILKVPMTEWNIGADAQDLFDAVFNYFPITFRPPPEDPYGITAQHLKDRLRECIASTADFAPYSFPALLDKLDSTSINTKRDVLQTLTACIHEYGPRTVSLYAVTLWDALKFEILSAQEEDLAEEALKGLAEIARQLSQNTAGSLNAYIKPITKECNEHLEDAPTKQSASSGRILHAISKVSPEVEDLVLSAVLPNIFTLYQTGDTMAKRRGLIEVLVELLRADIAVHGEWRLVDSEVVHPGPRTPDSGLLRFRDQALEIMSNGLATAPIKEVSFRLAALNGLLQLTKARLVLNDDDIAKVISVFDDIVISEESYGKDEVKAAAVAGLVEIAHQKPQLVIDKAFPAFMAELPDKDIEGSDSYVLVLEAFAKLATEEQTFPTVVLRLKNKCNAAIQQGASEKYIIALLSAKLFAFSQGAAKLEGTADSCPYYDDIILSLLSEVSSPEASPFNNEIALDIIGRLLNTILRQQNSAFQKDKVAPETYTLHSGESLESVPPFSTATFQERRKRIVLSTHILAALRRDATPIPDTMELLTALMNFAALEDLSPRVRLATNSQISLVVNKFIPSSELKDAMTSIFFEPQQLLSTEKLDETTIRVIFAIIKGLVLRNAPILNTVLPSLLDLLKDPKHGLTVARGFASILAPDDILTKENHCTISGLHKQKTFNLLVPAIASSFRSADPATKTNYLIGLSGILRWVPYAVIEPELPQLTPLLLQCLDLQQSQAPPGQQEQFDNVKRATVDTLIAVLSHEPKTLEEHAASLITRLLNTATADSAKSKAVPVTSSATNSPALRAVALKCLGLIPERLRGEVLLPFKRQVVKKLTAALDDSKRAVRLEAVKCRGAWLGMDEVDEDDE